MMTHGGMRPGMMGGGGGYAGGPIMQSQVPTGYAADINSSVQPVMAVPNPSYLPASSVSGLRQPAPPYDSVQVSITQYVLYVASMYSAPRHKSPKFDQT